MDPETPDFLSDQPPIDQASSSKNHTQPTRQPLAQAAEAGVSYPNMVELGRAIPEDQIQQEVEQTRPSFPHGQIALEAFRKVFPNDPEKIATMRRVIDTFFQQEMDNSAIFIDQSGATLPYTKINLTDLARAITGVPDSGLQAHAPKHKRFFILPSFPQLQNGHQFTFVEVAIKEVMKYLPGVVEDLQSNKTAPDIEVFTLGSPTNKKWGTVTPAYLSLLQRDAYGTLGRTYAGFMAGQLPTDLVDRTKTAIVVQGQSMSASLAAAAAEKLIAEGQATQDGSKRQGVPFVQVLMDAPVTLNRSKHRKMQIKSGFALDGLYHGITSNHIRKSALGEAKFIESVSRVLAKRGIATHEDKDEIALKEQAKRVVLNAMFNERMPIDPSKLKVNIRRGMYDLTNPPFKFAWQAWTKMRSYQDRPQPIGTYLVPAPQLDVVTTGSDRVRASAVRGMHIFPVLFSKHEMQKWGNGIDKIARFLT